MSNEGWFTKDGKPRCEDLKRSEVKPGNRHGGHMCSLDGIDKAGESAPNEDCTTEA